jgi:hypothetical protein
MSIEQKYESPPLYGLVMDSYGTQILERQSLTFFSPETLYTADIILTTRVQYSLPNIAKFFHDEKIMMFFKLMWLSKKIC